jgi:tetratricopeptide (TPR) repeat protein
VFTAWGYYIALFFTVAVQRTVGVVEEGEESAFDAFGDLTSWVREAVEQLPTLVEVVATAALWAIALLALTLLLFSMWKRVRRASLVVRAFADSSASARVGSGVAALVEERLIGALRRKGQIRDGYELDLVITDVDLLSEDNDLAKAVERLAEVPQFQFVVAVLDLIERLLPSRGLAAGGELLPVGDRGAGISLALYQGNRMTARSSLWEEEVKTWLPDADKDDSEGTGVDPGHDGGSDRSPAPYYRLAYPAAWWVQYEAARVLDANVSQITSSGRSFALVGLGLSRERLKRPNEAEEAYANALKHDFDNVAALFNLAQLLARTRQLYAPATLLLIHAGDVLFKRHQQARR